MNRVLEDISRLYELVDEMRRVVGRLREVNVDVRMQARADANDPLNSFAAMQITLKPGCETIEGR